MPSFAFALAEAAKTAADFEDDLTPVAIALFAIALIYAAVAAWIVTPKGDGHH